MRFLRIRAAAFGALRELDTGPEPLPGLVVVEGRNEAGKSTFFELLATLLYGFYPATRDQHPYAPWDGGNASGSAMVSLSGEREAEVDRSLLSTPRGTLVMGGTAEDLRNRTLPFVEHVPLAVFRNVFALTLGELAGLEGESWDEVQDRLLGGAMGASDLRSAREVSEELQAEAAKLWRSDRRGKQHIRDLESHRADLRKRRAGAAEEEAQIRAASEELFCLGEELEEAREERERGRVHLERFQTLLPVRQTLHRIRSLRAAAGDPALMDGLPREPEEALHSLRTRIEELDRELEEVERTREAPLASRAAFTEDHRSVLERERDIAALADAGARTETLRLRQEELERELRELQRRVETGIRRHLDRSPDPEVLEAVLALPIPRLQQALAGVTEAREGLARLDVHRLDDDGPVGEEPGPLQVPLGLLSVAVAVLVLYLVLGHPVLLGVGVGFLLGALITGSNWIRDRDRLRRRQAATADRKAREVREREEARDALHRAREDVATVLAPLAPGGNAPEPEPELPIHLEHLQERIREAEDQERTLAEVRTELAELEAGGDPLRPLLPEGDRGAPPSALLPLLSRALREATRRRDEAERAHGDLDRLEREEERITAARRDAERELQALETRLGELGQGDVEEGLKAAFRRQEAAETVRHMEKELIREHPDLPRLEEEIAAAEERGEEWVVDPDALARLRARTDQLDERVEVLHGQCRALETKMEHLAQRTTLDELDGEILTVEEEIRRLTRERDRLHVLGRVVQEAERRLRDEHQPAILREAGELLATLTGGRYDRLLLAGRDGRDFRVQGPGVPGTRAVESPLSTGTREQIYMAVRLAILSQLDRAGERLPLFLDEVLVNWDPDRREAGLEVLSRIARERQCFLFTCHPGMADRLQELGARRIRLQGP